MKIRSGKKAAARLKLRQDAWDALPAHAKQGTRRPGSRNPHKGTGSLVKKKGRKR